MTKIQFEYEIIPCGHTKTLDPAGGLLCTCPDAKDARVQKLVDGKPEGEPFLMSSIDGRAKHQP